MSDDYDFLPFNYTKLDNGNVLTEADGDMNYWFGMKTSLNFTLPNAVGSYDETTKEYGNQSIINQDMVYRFSGDDDVWVQVDGVTLLDLGGIHDVVYGEINFSKGTVTIAQNHAPSTYIAPVPDKDFTVIGLDEDKIKNDGSFQKTTDGSTTVYTTTPSPSTTDVLGNVAPAEYTVEAVIIKTFDQIMTELGTSDKDKEKVKSAGEHVLEFMYLERGSSEANAAIYFNVSTTYSLNFSKIDLKKVEIFDHTDNNVYTFNQNMTDDSRLTGAKFKIYSDISNPDHLVEAVLEPKAGSTTTRTLEAGGYVYSSTDGLFSFEHIPANQTFYLQEIASPAGYKLPSNMYSLRIHNDKVEVTDLSKNESWIVNRQDNSTYDTWIPNESGYELPATGGPGDWLIKGGGFFLVILSSILLIRRKRNEVANE